MKRSDRRLRVPHDVAALIRKMHPHMKKKVKASFRMILSDPEAGKALKDELSGLRSFRVSKFRIVYRIAKNGQISIVAVGPRERIYEETYRLLRKND